MSYAGNENATPELVRRYFRENNADGSPLSDPRLTTPLTDHRRTVERVWRCCGGRRAERRTGSSAEIAR